MRSRIIIMVFVLISTIFPVTLTRADYSVNNYLYFNPGHYQIFDESHGSTLNYDDEIEMVYQNAETDKFFTSLVSLNTFLESALLGRIDTSYVIYTSGYPSSNQFNYWFLVQLPVTFTGGETWSYMNTDYELTIIGDRTVNSVPYSNCIRLNYDSTLSDNTYLRGTGDVYFAPGVGIIDWYFVKSDGTIFSLLLNEYGTYSEVTLSGTVSLTGGTPAIGYHIGLSNRHQADSSITETDLDGAFSITGYGSSIILRCATIGVDDRIDFKKLDDHRLDGVTGSISGISIDMGAPFAEWEIDQKAHVSSVIDGDSFYVEGDEVRLADIDAPEWDQPGGTEATAALTNLIDDEIVYLDIDQQSGRDFYDRLVAVAYVKVNDQYLNVNKDLLRQGTVSEDDYTNNEFTPDDWNYYQNYPDNQELNLVVKGSDNRIYYKIKPYSSGWDSWSPLPGSTPDTPSAVIYDGNIHIVVRGSDDGLYHGLINQDTKVFGGWTKIGGSSPSAPILSVYSKGIVLGVRGSDDSIYYRIWEDSWGDWTKLPGKTVDTPGMTMLGDHLNIVVRGSNGKLYEGYTDVSTGTFYGWTVMSGSSPSAPVLVDDEVNMYCTVRGSNNRIYYAKWDQPNWGSWTLIPGSSDDSIGAACFGEDLHLMVKGMDNGLYSSSIDLATTSFNGWTKLQGSTPTAPTICGD